MARAFLYRTLSGNPLRTLPAGWGATGVSTRSVAGFLDGLPQKGRRRLEQIAADFLIANGIHEPITWCPPVADTAPMESARLASTVWPPSRPARTAAMKSSSADDMVRAYTAGASTSEIAADANVSRQTVSRILADAGTQTRRGRPRTFTPDPVWLREQYETHQRTIGQIARIAGCSETTANRHLRAAGIDLRPRGGRHTSSQRRGTEAADARI